MIDQHAPFSRCSECVEEWKLKPEENQMSEFFRIHATPEMHGLTLRQIAVMVHEAEETADDVTLLQCWDELERRGTSNGIFMYFYREEWRKRRNPK